MKKLLLPIFTLSVFLLIVPSSYALFGQKRARALAEEKARRAILEKQRVQNELLVVGGILVVVIIVAVVKINNPKAIPAIIQEVVVVRTPAHEIVANSVVIDATNVVRSSQGDPPCLLRLIGLLLELENRRYTYKCFFDANTGYVLEESGQREQAKAYRELLRDYYNIFIEVPGRTRADDFILDYAHSHGTPIISNDRYRDYAGKYPWVESAPNRLVRFVAHSSIMQLYSLGLEVKVPSGLASALVGFRNTIKPSSTRS